MENHFDNVAHDWDKNKIHIDRTEAIAKEMLKMLELNPNMKALEFGAGTALLSFALKDYFSEIVLMDNSIEMTKISTSKVIEGKINHIKPLFFDLEKNDYINTKFDIIYTQMALHHVEDVEVILNKFYNLLNPQGVIAIADLFKEDGTFHDYNFESTPKSRFSSLRMK